MKRIVKPLQRRSLVRRFADRREHQRRRVVAAVPPEPERRSGQERRIGERRRPGDRRNTDFLFRLR